jgi:arsenate reductase
MAPVFNGVTAARSDIDHSTLTPREMVWLMAEEHTFVTRPVIVRGDRATAGFSAKRIDELVSG